MNGHVRLPLTAGPHPPSRPGTTTETEGSKILKARKHLMLVYQDLFAFLQVHLSSFVHGTRRRSAAYKRRAPPAMLTGPAVRRCCSLLRRHAGWPDKLAPWKRHQCLGQSSEDDQVRQLDLFQAEVEQLTVAVLAVRDQLRRLLALQEHLSLKPDAETGLRAGPAPHPGG